MAAKSKAGGAGGASKAKKTTKSNAKPKVSKQQLEDLVLDSDTGARRPENKIIAGLLIWTAFAWSVFQLYIASPLMYKLPLWLEEVGIDAPWLVVNDTLARPIHLAFAMVLAYLAYPAFKNSPRLRIPVADWLLAGLALCATLYLVVFYEELSSRAGAYIENDIIIALVGLAVLLEATRRSLGPPLLIIASVFLLYTYFGSYEFIPDLIRHKGQSLNKIAGHQWLTTEGVFGIALGVSTSFVFLFVLFGSLLDKAGAGNYFIKLAFSLLGHLRGGPAKAAVLASGMTGLISGSSIANTVTTGTFTIPLMKRVGFKGSKAGAVEVAASVNGQIMPPVMGAAAFLMVEYVSIPYTEVIKHAFLPALISYIALIYMVHLEAMKSGMQGLPKPTVAKALYHRLLGYGIVISSLCILSAIVFTLLSDQTCFMGNEVDGLSMCINGLNHYAGSATPYIVAGLLLIAYLMLLKRSCGVPDLKRDDPNEPIKELPETGPTMQSGLHYILPIVVLIWCLMVERLSPGLSAFWASILMIFILATQKPLKVFFRDGGKAEQYKKAWKEGISDLFDGMVFGARNMIGIGVATAAAGIIVGTVSLTGIGQVLTEIVEAVAGGSLILILLLTAVICLILGMGLPTTANYIVVATLMAQVVQELGAQNGLFVPLIAIHLFVFYFGIMADVTPPVGLASFAAAAISGADPIRTGIQAFMYSLRTAVLPFFFIFNTELIMVGVDSIWHALFIFVYATIAILVFSASIQGYFFVKNKFYESVGLILVAVTLFVPQIWINALFPAYQEEDAKTIVEQLSNLPEGQELKLEAEGLNLYDEPVSFQTYIRSDGSGNGAAMLEEYGLMLDLNGDEILASDVVFNSAAEKAGFDFDYKITSVATPQEQPNARLTYIPAVLLLAFIVFVQLGRRRLQEPYNRANLA